MSNGWSDGAWWQDTEPAVEFMAIVEMPRTPDLCVYPGTMEFNAMVEVLVEHGLIHPKSFMVLREFNVQTLHRGDIMRKVIQWIRH